MGARATSAIIVASVLILLALLISFFSRSREPYITRKSHLLAAGVTLQDPHIRALNTGMR